MDNNEEKEFDLVEESNDIEHPNNDSALEDTKELVELNEDLLMEEIVNEVKEEPVVQEKPLVYAAPTGDQPRKKKKTVIIISIISVFVLIGAIIGAYFIFFKDNKPQTPVVEDKTVVFQFKEKAKDMYIDDSLILLNLLDCKNINLSDITYSVSDSDSLELSNGAIKAIYKDKVTVMAIYGDKKTSMEINIKDVADEYARLVFTTRDLYLYLGEGKNLEYEYESPTYNDNNLTWTSSNENVATVTNGKVTTKGVGKATITLKAPDRVCIAEDSCEFSINIFVNKYRFAVEEQQDGAYKTVDTIKQEIHNPNLANDAVITKDSLIRIRLLGKDKLIIKNTDITIDVLNFGGTTATLTYQEDDSSCENCFIYKLSHKFSNEKSSIENYSKVIFTAQDAKYELEVHDLLYLY